MQISVIDNMRQFKELLEVFSEVFEWEDNVVDDNYLTDSLNNKNFHCKNR